MAKWPRFGPPTPDGQDAAPGADGLIADEEALVVRAAFARLSSQDQELLHLRVVAGFTAEQVGAVVGKRAGAIRTAQARALERLRRLLAEAETGAEV